MPLQFKFVITFMILTSKENKWYSSKYLKQLFIYYKSETCLKSKCI